MSRWRNPLLLVLLLVCAGSWWWARREAAPVAAPGPTTGTPVADLPLAAGPAAGGDLASVHLAVLNGTDEAGLARRVSRHLADLGCVVVRIADAPHDTFAATLLINRRLLPRDARRLAHRLGDVRLLREWDDRATEDAVLVIGHDHGRRGLPPR